MKVTQLALVGLLALSSFSVSAYGTVAGRVAFTGRVVNAAAQPTEVTPARQADGTVVYVVTSTVTDQRLATFATREEAEYFAAHLSPATAYR